MSMIEFKKFRTEGGGGGSACVFDSSLYMVDIQCL